MHELVQNNKKISRLTQDSRNIQANPRSMTTGRTLASCHFS